ncbi:Maf family protein [Patescibacteria group bacterium]
MKIILASSSPSRKKLLTSLNIPFKVVVSDVDESKLKKAIKDPKKLVCKLALKKVDIVFKKLKNEKIENFLVIGADSIAALLTKKGWIFLDKPKNKHQARNMALLLKNKAHKFYTGMVLKSSKGKQEKALVATKVYFKDFSNKTLDDFIESEIWRGRAGGFDIEKNKSDLIAKWEGSYTNILGLPMRKLISLLKNFGVKIKKD